MEPDVRIVHTEEGDDWLRNDAQKRELELRYGKGKKRKKSMVVEVQFGDGDSE